MIVIYSATLTASVQFNEGIGLNRREKVPWKGAAATPELYEFPGWVGRLPSLSAGIHAKGSNLC